MTDQPLNEYIDLEAYDVVPGPQYRKLKEQLEAAQALLADTYGALAHQMDGELLAQYDDVFPLRERLKAIGLIVEGEPNLPDPQVLIDPGPVPNPASERYEAVVRADKPSSYLTGREQNQDTERRVSTATIIRCGECCYPNKTSAKLCVCCGACIKCSTSNQDTERP